MSQAWRECKFQICYLTEQHRQTGTDEKQRFGLSLNDILKSNPSPIGDTAGD